MSAGEDWTRGPAKWAAVVVLGAASVGGLVWSNAGRVPAALPREARVADVGATREAPPESKAGLGTGADEGTLKAEVAPERDRNAVATILDINTATAPELELLPEIGPALAGRIVEYREKHGPFKSIEGLNAVKGIGPKTLAKIRPFLTVK